MKELLNNALEQLKIARISLNTRSFRKQFTLFDLDDSQDVEFNGAKSPVSYHEQLYSFYLPCKRLVDEKMNEALNQSDSVKREFDLYCFEIREFRQRYFPKDNYEVLFYRLELHKSVQRELAGSEAIKKNTSLF
jgi:hypothetical protein